MKTDAAMNLINRIAEVENWPGETKAQFKYLFDQLSAINSLRNDIVHFGAFPTADDALLVSNAFMALTEDRVRKTVVSAEILKAMTNDLLKINAQLMVWAIGSSIPKNALDHLQRQIDAPWQYKRNRQLKAALSRTALSRF